MLLGLPNFEYLHSRTIKEACSFLSTYKGEAVVMAGGTDLLVKMKHRKARPRYLVNIKKIPDLVYIVHDEREGLRIGALTTIQTIRNSPLVMKKFSVLNQAAGVLGTAQVRNLATLGGNLCNASPASECAPALLTLEAKVKLAGPGGERIVPLESFFVGPGKSVLEKDEILTEIQIPNTPPHTEGVHLKHGTRRVDVAIVGATLLLTLAEGRCQDIRIGLGAVGPTPFRARKAEALLRGEKIGGEMETLLAKVAQKASEESFPIDDIRGCADYRKQVVEALVKEGLERLVGQTGS